MAKPKLFDVEEEECYGCGDQVPDKDDAIVVREVKKGTDVGPLYTTYCSQSCLTDDMGRGAKVGARITSDRGSSWQYVFEKAVDYTRSQMAQVMSTHGSLKTLLFPTTTCPTCGHTKEVL